MPSPGAVLDNLTDIANQWRILAVLWHFYLFVPLLFVIAGRPWGRSTVCAWLLPPVFSVSVVASGSGNFFNAFVFAGLSLLLAWSVIRMRDTPPVPASGLVFASGLGLFVFGLVYPHFLRASSWTEFAYAAPVGLLPCPTLAALSGITLMLGLHEERRWGRILAGAGLMYGVFGVLRLGVTLDLVLVAGASVLLAALVAPRSVRATAREAAAALPGDELIPSALDRLTHAITIRRPRRDVWPWLAQMGAGTRAGWYSYDLLDNGRRPSATRIVPELQHIERGMVFRALPHLTDGFTVLDVEPQRSLVLGFQRPGEPPEVTWAFRLDDAGPDCTRLVVRASGGPGYRWHGLPVAITKLVIRLVHFVMERKQLLGIAKRAEAMVN